MRKHTMKTRGRLVALAAAVAVVGGTVAAGPAGAAAPAAERGDHRAATQRALDGLVAAGMPGVAAETRTPRGTWFGTSGHADTDSKRKRTAADHFRAGSITKTFVATTVLQLAAEGRLSLDDSVERWLPGVVQGNGYDGNKITIRQLLNHTSGVHDMVSTEEWDKAMNGTGFLQHRYDVKTPQEIVAIGLRHKPDFAPGQGWTYSNTGFVLAGMIIEKVTGKPYASEIERRIVKPLGLTETTFPGTDPKLPAPHPVGYSKLYVQNPGPEIHDATEYRPSWSGATGEVVSTSGDLNRFYSALLQGRLLPRKQLDEMLTTVDTGQQFRYGLGIMSRALTCGTTVWGHDGVVWGSLSGAAVTRDGKNALTFNINGDWLDQSPPFENMFEGAFCGTAAAKPVNR
ncbi:serine hydrolase [Streptomyces sp. UNOB3_S3]|uniref:serine hydrolase domain-containing protein n=1 Tax=Streptomyces sp. UNOB3_S3 TaxID=2871682 RepID=UPI001E32E91F|nr:serine hydrolase domain-containing protein [Streptomyces sp. UNOB3_S3]MCC3773713.1 beta-lactamase family protein [Streptomyces sp. UNOB3_S3]